MRTKLKVRDIIYIDGRKDLLLIAPHGHKKDDENTAELTRLVAERLECQAVLNFVFRKPLGNEKPDPASRLLNLNKTDQALLHPGFLKSIQSSIDAPGRTLVIWMHGIKDENIEAEAHHSEIYGVDHSQLLVLAGYGQGKSPKTGNPNHRFTARTETVEKLVGLLTQNNLPAGLVREDAANYRGRNEDYMNQWFLQNGYPLTSVESIQLELKYTGVRDLYNLEAASTRFADAFKEIIY